MLVGACLLWFFSTSNPYAYPVYGAKNNLIGTVNAKDWVSGNAIPANGWAVADIPMSAFGISSPTAVSGFDVEPSAATTPYFDDVLFVTAPLRRHRPSPTTAAKAIKWGLRY